TDRAASAIKAQLVPGEELLWSGTPRLGLWARPYDSWYGLAVFVWITYLLYELRSIVLLQDVYEERFILGYLFLAVVSLANIVYDIIRRNNSYFGLTDRRAISVNRTFGLHANSAALARVDAVTVTERRKDCGTVSFGGAPVRKSAGRTVTAPQEWPMTGPVVFDMIKDVDQVASLVNSIIDKRNEVAWDDAVADLSHRSAKSGDINIAYAEAGIGKPIVFLHGVGATKKCWAMQMRTLSQKFRCIALDYRGYGDSDVPPIDAISRESYAQDVAAVMDAAGIDKAVLCGNSLGGVVALEFYKLFPQRVRSLVLVDSFAFYPGGVESIPDRIKTLDELGIEKFAETRSPALFAPDAPKWLVERARADLASIPLDVYKASTRVTWSGDYRELLPKINVGALVVWGEHDTKIAPLALSKELMFGIPGASDLMVVPRAGHIPQMEAPHEFNRLLSDFLS
ncbi:MAG TPA: alpha/beta hydrolase, partial [Candidatus Eremiobacteraceae bacterium]